MLVGALFLCLPYNESMAKVDKFNSGKFAKDDEYYTQYEDIQNELNHYTKFFYGKTVICNCDDPFESAFCKFFLKNFNYLKLKRLICTSYNSSPMLGTQMSLFDDMDLPVVAGNGYGYVMDISNVPMKNGRGVSDDDIEKLLHSKQRGVKKLKGNGDFRSRECIDLLKQADIVCTNPPFSKFREYVDQIMEYKKEFLIIGRETSITYKDTFDYIINNEAWYGYTHAKRFLRPNGEYKTFGNIAWLTNLYVSRHHVPFVPYRHYNADEYDHYYNFDGIDIDSVSEIPSDYYGYMGVPLNFLFGMNPDQFEIIGMGQTVEKTRIHKTISKDEIAFIDAKTGSIIYRMPYSVPERKRGNQLRIDENGKPGRVPFGRIIIRRKK